MAFTDQRTKKERLCRHGYYSKAYCHIEDRSQQATNVRGMLPVLVISTVGAFIVLAGLYIYYFGLGY